jgi:hypothetical protein
LIYKTIIRFVVIYASIIWHASHNRSDNVIDTTTKLIKMQQQCLKMISDNFKTMSTQILEVEIYVKLIQLHLAHLQIKFRQRMKKQHDAFIFNFCNRIKSCLTTQRDKRRRRAVETSNERKQKWSAKLAKKMRKKNKMNENSIEKTWHRLFRVKWQQTWNVYQTKNRRRVYETLTNDISSKRLKLHKVLTKSESAFVTHIRTRRIELADYLFFRRVFTVLLSDLGWPQGWISDMSDSPTRFNPRVEQKFLFDGSGRVLAIVRRSNPTRKIVRNLRLDKIR